jgi:hypothetical protein
LILDEKLKSEVCGCGQNSGSEKSL